MDEVLNIKGIDTNIIVIVLIIVVSIISGIVKHIAKKNAENTPPPYKAEDEDDPWYMPKTNEIEEREFPKRVEEREHFSYDNIASDDHKPRQSRTANLYGKSKIAAMAEHNRDEDAESTESQVEAVDEIISEFSLREAVIYSEILKPKFED